MDEYGHSEPWIADPYPGQVTYSYTELPPEGDCVMGCGTKLADQPAGLVCDACAQRAVQWIDSW